MPVTYPIIQFGRNAIETKADATFSLTTGTLQSFSNLDDLKTNIVTSKPYATYEPDFWLLDGNYHFKPDSNVHVGLMTTNMSDGDGNFVPSLPTLTIEFGSLHSTNGITLHFSLSTGDYADFFISYYNGVSLIDSSSYSPSSPDFSIGAAVSNFDKIEIQFETTNRPYRYARLKAIDFDTFTTFSKDQIKEAQLIEQIDVLGMELPAGQLTFTLFSSDGDFNIIDPQGVYATLQKYEPIELYESIDNESVYLGRYYIDEWKSKSDTLASFTAFDVLARLEAQKYYNGDLWLPGILTTDLLDDLFSVLGMSYTIDSFWTTFYTPGHLPIINGREALHQIVFVLCSNSSYTTNKTTAIVSCARSNVVNIKAQPLAETITSPTYTLTTADYSNPNIELKQQVTGVEVIGFLWRTSDTTIDLINESMDAGDHTILFSTPVGLPLAITGATLTTSTINYAVINVASPGTVHLYGVPIIDTPKLEEKTDPTVTDDFRKNIVRVDTAVLMGHNISLHKAKTIYDYLQERVLFKGRLFASAIAPGDSALITLPDGKQLMTLVEKMTTDLTGGMLQDIEAVGVEYVP